MAQNDTLNTKQKRAIAALLMAGTNESAAERAGVSVRTLYRWLELGAFQEALKRAEALAIDKAARRLAGGLDSALESLGDLVTGAESESVRRAAAAEWINQALKVQELRTLAERVDLLEKALNNGT